MLKVTKDHVVLDLDTANRLFHLAISELQTQRGMIDFSHRGAHEAEGAIQEEIDELVGMADKVRGAILRSEA